VVPVGTKPKKHFVHELIFNKTTARNGKEMKMKIYEESMRTAIEATSKSVEDAVKIVDRAFGENVVNKPELTTAVMSVISSYYLSAVLDTAATDLVCAIDKLD
jgi:uncharacterized protein YqgV (UPF0045/DUF77 family)